VSSKLERLPMLAKCMNSSHSCNYGRYGVAHIESYAQTCKQGQCEHITVSGAQDGNYVLCAELTYSCDFYKSTANVNATCGQLTEIGFILNTYDASQATFAGWTQTVYGTLSDASYSVCYGVKKSHGAWGELELITK
jgi:hypothetical protein